MVVSLRSPRGRWLGASLVAASAAILVVVTVVFWPTDESDGSVDPARPGSAAELRTKVRQDGSILVLGNKRTKSYLLVLEPAGGPSKSGELVALYPRINGANCLLHAKSPVDNGSLYATTVCDCTGGCYDSYDLRRYDLRELADGQVAVDTSRLRDPAPA